MRARMREGSGRVIKTQFYFQETMYFGPKNIIRRKKPLKLEEWVPTDGCAPATPMFLELTWRLAGLKLNARRWAMRERKRKREKARRLSRASMSGTGRRAGVASPYQWRLESARRPSTSPNRTYERKNTPNQPSKPERDRTPWGWRFTLLVEVRISPIILHQLKLLWLQSQPHNEHSLVHKILHSQIQYTNKSRQCSVS